MLGLLGCATQEAAPVVTREPQPPAPEERPREYQVIRGDSLYAIAWRYDLDYRQVAAWNGIGPPYLIYAGQTLHLYPTTPSPRKPNEETPSAITSSATPRRHFVHDTKSPASAPRTAKSRLRIPRTPPSRGQPKPPSRDRWIWPTRGQVVQTFMSADRTRQGIRIAGNLGQDVVATKAGRVVYSGSGLPSYGQLIIIKHAENYLSAYGFNRKLLVQENSSVAQGERVAEMGRAADGKPMLHFEIRHGGAAVDPMKLLPHP